VTDGEGFEMSEQAEATQAWTVGAVRITSVVESQTDHIPVGLFFPKADEGLVAAIPWLTPDFADADGAIGMRVQALVVEAGGRTIVVDPCVGNHKHRSLPWWDMQDWPLMERFLAAGFTPEGVDAVVHTHLHADHVGWGTTRVDGAWAPTFPHAEYLYTQAELDSLTSGPRADSDDRAIHADSVAPVLDAGLARVVAPDDDLGGGLRLRPTGGHTPGHTSLWVDGGGGALAVLAGDVIHHQLQCALPDQGFVSDADPEEAASTRIALLDEVATTGAVLLPAHFPTWPAGRLVPGGESGAWRFVAEAGTG
jgi:glyoxylase-like metal-dependent hydrolase (beta-lactamase superfamily II)